MTTLMNRLFDLHSVVFCGAPRPHQSFVFFFSLFGFGQIYNGFAGFFDYGPLGVELKKNIKDAWWRDVVQTRDDIVGLDSSIISNPKVRCCMMEHEKSL